MALATLAPLPGTSTCAIVVTYNRRALLEECLQALRDQSRPPDEVIVVDNASTDGSARMVRERFPEMTLEALPENVGGAGGFHHGLRLGHARGHDWLWLMDDDTIATPEALERLLGALDRLNGLPEPAMLGSKAVWTDGNWHPMNFVGARLADYPGFLEASIKGLISVRTMTFVSLLVKSDAVRRYGLPHKHYFIWSDDIEWTARVLMHERGYLVADSVVEHKTKTAHTAPETGEKFYYAIRNGLFLLRSSSFDWKEKITHTMVVAEQVRRFLIHERFGLRGWRVVARGTWHGLTRRAQ
jgi:rhamnopyranosyl-N-acetylglucosaminyl-diphospho-decaprenol beta-1,3/1,4-galactofuranosyltransferase